MFFQRHGSLKRGDQLLAVNGVVSVEFFKNLFKDFSVMYIPCLKI